MKGKRLTAAVAAALALIGSRRRHRRRDGSVRLAQGRHRKSGGGGSEEDGPEERDLPARRRHGHAGDHRRPLLPGRHNAQRRPDAVHRLRHHLVGQAGRRRRRTCPTTTPTRPPPAQPGRPARKPSTSGSHRARAAPKTSPAPTSRRCSRSPRNAGMKVGDVSTAEITDATPAVLASHISLRGCQGPADMAPARWRRRRRRPRLDRRAGGRPQGRRPAGRRTRPLPRRSPAAPAGRPSSSRPRPRVQVRHRRRRAQPGQQHRARPVQHRQHDDRVDRPGDRARQEGPGGLHRGQRPATQPTLAEMTRRSTC